MTTPELFRLDGRVALVTGGAGIYGRHIVQALAEAGTHVVAVSRDEEHCRRFASELTARGLAVNADRCDLGDEAGIIALRDRLLARHGRLDVLFNNVHLASDPGHVFLRPVLHALFRPLPAVAQQKLTQPLPRSSG